MAGNGLAHFCEPRPLQLSASRPGQNRLQRIAGVGAQLHQGFRRVGRYHAATTIATFGSEVNHPIGFGDHIQIVFDDHHAVATINQTVQHPNQFVHIGHVQAHRGFVQYIQGVRCFVATACHIVTHLAEFGHQFDALCFTTAERG